MSKIESSEKHEGDRLLHNALDGLLDFEDQILEHIRTGKTPPIATRQALRHMRRVRAILEAAAFGGWKKGAGDVDRS